jgi:hypothetical protein
LQPVGAAITDANGNVTFHLPSHVPLDGHAVGFSGYFELSGPAIVPQLAFLEFPLSEPAATMTVSIGVTDGIQMIYDQANVTPDARLGFVWVSADDCHWLPAMGVTVRAMGPGQIPLAVTYDQGGAATGLFGSAYLLDAPIEDITLEVDVPGIGGVVTPVSIFTAPGKMSSIILHPNLYVSARAPIGRPAPTQAR